MTDSKEKALDDENIKFLHILPQALPKNSGNKIVIPKPETNVSSLIKNKMDDLKDYATTNNSPPCNWVSNHIQEVNSYNDVIVSKTNPDSEALIGSFNYNHNGHNQGEASLNSMPELCKKYEVEKVKGLFKRSKNKKKRLSNLKSLYNLLIKIFLQQSVSLCDLRLKDYELHMLCEILIRKNKKLSLGR